MQKIKKHNFAAVAAFGKRGVICLFCAAAMAGAFALSACGQGATIKPMRRINSPRGRYLPRNTA